MRALRSLLLLSTLLMVASCRPPSLYFVQPSGPPEYKLGWEDGCDTGLAAQGGMVAKAAYGYKKRPELLDNSLYNTAWNEGFTYCRFSLDPVDKSQWFN
jgi:hypothetical protein